MKQGGFDAATGATAAAMAGLFVILRNRRFSSWDPLGPLDLSRSVGARLASRSTFFGFSSHLHLSPCCAAPPFLRVVGGEL
jgi:hypothetical protein